MTEIVPEFEVVAQKRDEIRVRIDSKNIVRSLLSHEESVDVFLNKIAGDSFSAAIEAHKILTALDNEEELFHHC